MKLIERDDETSFLSQFTVLIDAVGRQAPSSRRRRQINR